MAKRVPASMCTRESLSDLIEGRLSSAAGRAEPVKLAARLIVEEALETESRDVLDRDYFGLACRGRSEAVGHKQPVSHQDAVAVDAHLLLLNVVADRHLVDQPLGMDPAQEL